LTNTQNTQTAPVAVKRSNTPGKTRLPLVVYVLALGTFLMLTTEFVVAGILPEVAGDLQIPLAQAGNLISVFAAGMFIGAPAMALLTMRLSKRLTLVLALIVFVAGHVIVAMATDFTVLLGARFITAVATGAFWAVSAVVATRAASPAAGARAMGIVSAGGALATVLGVPVGAFIAQIAGWRGTFWFLAAAATVAAFFVARLVPADGPNQQATPIRIQIAGLRSGRLWLALLACATTTGGVLAAYSYIAPILIDQAAVPATLVPLVLTAFGVGSFIGTILAGRFGDTHPGLVTILTPAVTTVVLVAIGLTTGLPWVMTALVVILGLFGLSASGVLIHLAVRFSGEGATLASALAVSAFNAGTAVGTAVAGVALTTPLGTHGPATVGAVIVALTLIPAVILAAIQRRRSAPPPAAAGAEKCGWTYDVSTGKDLP
jgi:DHA1 family inner membrane transport protein